MAIKLDIRELEGFARFCERKSRDARAFLRDTAEELAIGLRDSAAAKTSVVSGRMKESWKVKPPLRAGPDGGYKAVVYNDAVSPGGAHYSGYVNDGHAIRRVKGGPILGKVEGQHMLQEAEKETEQKTRGFVEAGLAEFLGGLNG
jgi:hypothetical protein